MTQKQDIIRKVGSLALPSLYYSMGFARDTFVPDDRPLEPPFDAVVDCGNLHPDCVWFFRGESYYRFNVRDKRFEEGEDKDCRISSFATGWPASFAGSVDSALWGGSEFPNFWYFIKGSEFIRVNIGAKPQVDAGVRPLTAWGDAAFAATRFLKGCDTMLHGVTTEDFGKMFLFKDGECITQHFATGRLLESPKPIADVWRLPEPFSNGVDLAFYGSGGRDSETIYFIRGDLCVTVDARTRTPGKVVPVERMFSRLARYLPKPQILAVEDYALETYVGPVQRGRAIGASIFVPPGGKESVRMITETEVESTSTIEQSVLQSEDHATVADLRSEIRNENKSEEDSDSYRYRMNAKMHGEASAKGIWGGEVDAQLNVEGGSDQLRRGYSEAAQKAVSKQVTKTQRQLTQTAVSATSEYKTTKKIVSEKIASVENSGNVALSYQFYSQNEPYWVLVVLKKVRLAFADGLTEPREFELYELDELLTQVMGGATSEQREAVRKRVIGGFTKVTDWCGEARRVVTNGSGPARFDDGTTSKVVFRGPTFEQSLDVPGLVKSLTEKLLPINALTHVQNVQA